jgi:hypothetical protein
VLKEYAIPVQTIVLTMAVNYTYKDIDFACLVGITLIYRPCKNLKTIFTHQNRNATPYFSTEWHYVIQNFYRSKVTLPDFVIVLPVRVTASIVYTNTPSGCGTPL